MPWSNQSGGGGGGPWGPRKPGPWGGGPQGGGGGAPPDLEELLRRSQDRIRQVMPGGQMGGKGILAVAIGAVLLWAATGFYTVRPDEVGLNLVFGRYVGTTQPGLNYNFPYPIGSVVKPRVTVVNTTEVGYRTSDPMRRVSSRDVTEESLMLTGDENIVDIDFAVQWQINPAKAADYVFNIQSPESSVKAVAESAMREVVGRRNIQQILTTDRGPVEAEVKQVMQDTLNHYGAGVEIRLVQLQKVDPPAQVIDAFRDVQAARQDQDRARNEADTYASKVVPEARGEAARIVQEAEAYRERVVAEANGQASRFTQVYEEYRKAPDITRQRMYLETMERVLGGADKIIVDQNSAGAQGIVPYLPLNELQRRPGTGAQR
ncbi:FtsH protease activity modulator HflK [Alsobacter sp. SYSU M60028]|uniref:Protein HflK n=1 Tax=Alsobacter ponti TaxID=2962936 RepID=A0ABT1L8Z7_9HYPH|nr:FtsH protease activity modulator HflK [Alsobacter ponti]MCP8937205.1 FtsH protease activity modulator HflK [Alsobacter ponti]